MANPCPQKPVETRVIELTDLEYLHAIKDAATQLVRCKGRYHSELNYKALAKLLGVHIADVSPWHDRNNRQPILPESQVAGDDIFQFVAILARWQGDAHPCVSYYRGNNQFQHADGTDEGRVGWGGKVYHCIEWMELPK